MPPVTRNRFAPALPSAEERKRRLYLLDSNPVHTLQIFGVPQYLPKDIHGFDSVSSEDFLRHHERVRALIADGRLTFGFDEQGVETSLALVFGFDVPVHKGKTSDSPPTKKIRVLQLYYEAPATEDVPPGVFGGSGVQGSAWTEVEGNAGARTFQRSGVGSGGSSGL